MQFGIRVRCREVWVYGIIRRIYSHISTCFLLFLEKQRKI